MATDQMKTTRTNLTILKIATRISARSSTASWQEDQTRKKIIEVVNIWWISCILASSPTTWPKHWRTQVGPAFAMPLHCFASQARKCSSNHIQYRIPSSTFLGFGSLARWDLGIIGRGSMEKPSRIFFSSWWVIR